MAARILMTIGGVMQFASVALVFAEIAETERLLDMASWWRRTITLVLRPLRALIRRMTGRRGRVVELRGAVGLTGTLDAARVRATPAERRNRRRAA